MFLYYKMDSFFQQWFVTVFEGKDKCHCPVVVRSECVILKGMDKLRILSSDLVDLLHGLILYDTFYFTVPLLSVMM